MITKQNKTNKRTKPTRPDVHLLPPRRKKDSSDARCLYLQLYDYVLEIKIIVTKQKVLERVVV